MAETIPTITICQPYAHLIVTPQDELPHSPVSLPREPKRVENRCWPTSYRGPLAIHAGQSRRWIEMAEDENGHELAVDIYGLKPAELTYGAVVGLVDLVDCVQLDSREQSRNGVPAWAEKRYPWLPGHLHTEGPWCWILENVRRLEQPIPASGRQKLWQWTPPAELRFYHG